MYLFKATISTPFSAFHLAPLCPLQNCHKFLSWVLMGLISGSFVGDNKRELLFPWGNWENKCEWGDDGNHLAINMTPTERKAETKEGRKRQNKNTKRKRLSTFFLLNKRDYPQLLISIGIYDKLILSESVLCCYPTLLAISVRGSTLIETAHPGQAP